MGNKNFNIIITGTGGQGIITLISLLDEACLLEGKDVRSSELHGLSQRGGSVLSHLRIGKKVFSPLILKGEADLIISLDLAEALRVFPYSNKKTKFLVNDYLVPLGGDFKKEEIKALLKNLVGENLFLVSASDVCREKLNNDVVSGIYLLGYAIFKNLLPLKSDVFVKAIKELIPQPYQEINIKAFYLSND